jgi:hypothetical protein
MLIGAGQRGVNVIRPDWNWLLPVGRFVADGAGAVVMFFFRTHVLVMAADASSAAQQHLAEVVNGRLVWGLFGPWLWLYLGITALVYGWYCRPIVRRLIQQRGGKGYSTNVLKSLI